MWELFTVTRRREAVISRKMCSIMRPMVAQLGVGEVRPAGDELEPLSLQRSRVTGA